MRTSTNISLCANEVSIGTRLEVVDRDLTFPDGPRARQTAASTVAHGGEILGGIGLTPATRPTVPRLRTTGSAITFSASRKIGHTATTHPT